MKTKKFLSAHPKPLAMKVNPKSIFRIEGKMLHGTFGKPTNGARGNKKY